MSYWEILLAVVVAALVAETLLMLWPFPKHPGVRPPRLPVIEKCKGCRGVEYRHRGNVGRVVRRRISRRRREI